MTDVDKKIDGLIHQLREKVKSRVDRGFIENELAKVIDRMKANKEAGNPASLRDLQDILKIARNIYIPLAINKQIDRLQAVKELIKVHNGTVGIR